MVQNCVTAAANMFRWEFVELLLLLLT